MKDLVWTRADSNPGSIVQPAEPLTDCAMPTPFTSHCHVNGFEPPIDRVDTAGPLTDYAIPDPGITEILALGNWNERVSREFIQSNIK
ncbi:hypothetical protein RB195_007500 [Necator americanus]|uniref:Uncharacterized protein n=1 Tax=Necator americanus TaxID=51031 RepID=A0ABR1BXM6_NECAM